MVGERWSLLILRDAMFSGFTRFSQFQKSLGIATNILAKRLEGFVVAGLMEQPRSSGAQAEEYLLTQKGLELKPVIIALTEWGDKWLQPGPVVERIRWRAGRASTSAQCGRRQGQGRRRRGPAPLALHDAGACEIRTVLPDGSRNAQSRGPHGWSMGS